MKASKSVSTTKSVNPKVSSASKVLSLYSKLGLHESMRVYSNISLQSYQEMCGLLPLNCVWTDAVNDADIGHFFVNEMSALNACLQLCEAEMHDKEIIWVSWYKKSAKLPTELTEDRIRDAALQGSLVDIKVCSINEQWSALKLMRRTHLRSNSKVNSTK